MQKPWSLSVRAENKNQAKAAIGRQIDNACARAGMPPGKIKGLAVSLREQVELFDDTPGHGLQFDAHGTYDAETGGFSLYTGCHPCPVEELAQTEAPG